MRIEYRMPMLQDPGIHLDPVIVHLPAPVESSAFHPSVALDQSGDPGMVGVAVQLGEQLVRAELRVVAPPSSSCVVPDSVASRHSSGYVPPSAQGETPSMLDDR